MNDKTFSIQAELKEGWELTKVNIGFLVVYQIILWAMAVLFGGNEERLKMIILNSVGILIVMLGKMGLYNSILMITTGAKPGFDQFYRNWPKLLNWFVANFLFGILFLIGICLLIAPGFYVLARFGLFPFFILDKNAGPIEAMKQASQATEGIRWPVCLLFLACIGINLLGLLFFVVGLLITVPISLFALATVYRQITGQSKNSIQPSDILPKS